MENGEFRLVTCHINTGEVPVPVYSAEHFYFWTGYLGWDKVTLNGQPLAPEAKREGNSAGIVSLQETNVLTFPEREISLEMVQHGLPYAVIWAGTFPRPEETSGGVGYECHYVCIEPAEGKPGFFGAPESMIQPWDSRTTQIVLTLNDRH